MTASRGASPVSSRARLSEGNDVKDVGLSREAYSKARNLLMKRNSETSDRPSEGSEASGDEQENGFKRVGKALVAGMSSALFNRRGSDKNQGLIKSLMAAISKEKIFNRITEIGMDEEVSEMLGQMYQAMMDLLIDNYEPLEVALGRLLDEAVMGNQELSPMVLALRQAVKSSLMEVINKHSPGDSISEAQELLLNQVTEAAQAMASEIAYAMRMRGGNRQRNSAPPPVDLSDLSGEGSRLTSSARGSRASVDAGRGSHLKKTVRNMFLMNKMGGRGPRFHTDVRAEQRKNIHDHEDELSDANQFAHVGEDVVKTQSTGKDSSGKAGNAGKADEDMDAWRSDESGSYGMPPSSGSGLSLGSSPSKKDGDLTLTGSLSFGLSDDGASSPRMPAQIDEDGLSPISKSTSTNSDVSPRMTGITSSKSVKEMKEEFWRSVRKTVTTEDLTPGSQSGSRREGEAAANQRGQGPGQPGRGPGHAGPGHVGPEPTPRGLSGKGEGLSIGSIGPRGRRMPPGGGWRGLGDHGDVRKGQGMYEKTQVDPLQLTGQHLGAVSAAMPRRAAGGAGDTAGDMDSEQKQGGFDWDSFRTDLLREGIKLKIPRLRASRVSRVRLQDKVPEAAMTWHGSPRSVHSRFTTLSGLLRNGSRKSVAANSCASRESKMKDSTDDLWSSEPVAPSCNANLHRAWKQDAVALEEIYQRRALPWDKSPRRNVPALGLVPLVGRRQRETSRMKNPILPFRSTCFCSDGLLPEIVTFPVVTDDFMESVYSLSLEHSRASWIDTNTMSEWRSKSKRGRECKGLKNLHKHFYSVV